MAEQQATTARAVPASFDAAAVGAIDGLLDDVVAQEGVTVPLAVESGSRAWGFPSPDSDYDCRFVYVRPVEAYLTPWLPRDVLERVPDAVLDVNGWDLRKAVDLAVRGNAVIGEWLRSPVVYRADPGFVERFRALLDEVSDRAAVGRHYLHVGLGQRERFVADDGSMPLKKTFYVLRPALTLRWLDQRPSSSTPPMDLATLVAEVGLSSAEEGAVADLVAAKAASREMARGPVPAPLAALLARELVDRPWLAERRDPGTERGVRALAAEFFRTEVERFDPGRS